MNILSGVLTMLGRYTIIEERRNVSHERLLKMAATIKDIAKKAGVSISTASNVLNNKTGIIKASQETRQKIIAAAEELDYSPSIMARGLRSGKSSMVGMVLPVIYSSFFPEILQGIEDVLNKNNYNMILCTYKSMAEFREKWKVLHSKQVDGIITLPSIEKDFAASYAEIKSRMPLVFTAGKLDGLDIPYVYVPPAEIGRIGAKYLLEKGHRDIGILGPRPDGFLDMFTMEMKKYPGAKCVVSTPLSMPDEAAPEFMKMLKKFKDMTAVMAFNDDVAARIIYEAGKAGIRVPDDLSVIGVDDLPICRMTNPNITTIAQPRYEQGSEAAQILMDLINGKTASEGKALSPSLVERESCRSMNQG